MRTRLFIPALCFFSLILNALPIDQATAARVAASQVYIMNTRAENNAVEVVFDTDLHQVNCLFDKSGTSPVAYVFELQPEGFVVVTGDDDLVPVIAYSEHGRFPWEEHPENHLLNMLREDLRLRLIAVELMDAERIEEYHRQWDGLIAGDREFLDPGDSWPPEGSTSTGGWVESAWHQRSPYNSVCPVDPLTMERCVVGCVATALGQILNFWQYPDSIIFTEADNYVTETRQISIHAPDANIPEIDYRNGSPTNGTCAAISYACGVGVKMNYTSESSGAYYSDTHEFILNNLNFESADYDTTADDEFYSTLENNMKNAQPAFLGITESEDINWGHAIICDGFRETVGDNEWHLNYGWGNYNPDPLLSSWYVLPEGLPAGYSWVDIGILNIYPPQVTVMEEPIRHGSEILICNGIFTGYSDKISYSLNQESLTSIEVWNTYGQRVKTLVNTHQTPGTYMVTWDGCDENGHQLPSGIYYLRFQKRDCTNTQKIILIR